MKEYIKLYDIKTGKDTKFSLKEGIKILRIHNPKEKFRIIVCKETNKRVIQNWHEEDKNWLCLHD
jgi:hypothetical protein